ncbi:hypothetical protein D3C71_1639290 [compost metagenome]
MLPALMVLPTTVRSESLPAPVALMRTSPPAVMLEPAALSCVVVVLLSLRAPPTVMEMLMPPAAPGSACTAPTAAAVLSTVVAAANVFMRLSSVWLAAFFICSALWIAEITGAVNATVRPAWRNLSSWVATPVSRASTISTLRAWMSTSPTGATTWLPTWR